MPRSNRKKNPQKPPPKDPPYQSLPDTLSVLLSKERNLMISRAINSGRKHGINLINGSQNPGNGDCAFESVILNNNDRTCFNEKFLMPINHYRRIWVTDMANRTINSEWNIYSNKQWIEGWQQMLIPGTYERGIFGDLMLPGIACGVKKYLLIFNTGLETPHDPIYVVNPETFGVKPDIDIPIVLSYNLSHYESMNPLNHTDIQATVNLVRTYLRGTYRFKRQDLPYVLGLINDVPGKDDQTEDGRAETKGSKKFEEELPKKIPNKDKRRTIKDAAKVLPRGSQTNEPNQKKDLFVENEIDLKEIDDFLDKNDAHFEQTISSTKRENDDKKIEENPKNKLKKVQEERSKIHNLKTKASNKNKNSYPEVGCDNDFEETNKIKLRKATVNRSKTNSIETDRHKLTAFGKTISRNEEAQLCYKLKKKTKEIPIKQSSGKKLSQRMFYYILGKRLNVVTK